MTLPSEFILLLLFHGDLRARDMSSWLYELGATKLVPLGLPIDTKIGGQEHNLERAPVKQAVLEAFKSESVIGSFLQPECEPYSALHYLQLQPGPPVLFDTENVDGIPETRMASIRRRSSSRSTPSPSSLASSGRAPGRTKSSALSIRLVNRCALRLRPTCGDGPPTRARPELGFAAGAPPRAARPKDGGQGGEGGAPLGGNAPLESGDGGDDARALSSGALSGVSGVIDNGALGCGELRGESHCAAASASRLRAVFASALRTRLASSTAARMRLAASSAASLRAASSAAARLRPATASAVASRRRSSSHLRRARQV